MAKSKKPKSYDVGFDDYEDKSGAGYDGEVPKKGTYDGKLVSVKEHTSGEGNDGFEWIWEITEEPYAGWRGWAYTNMETAKWKTQQFLLAVSGGDDSKPVKFQPMPEDADGTESPTVAKAKPVRIRTRTEMFDDEKRAKVQSVMPMDPDAGGGKKKKGKKKKKDEPF